MPEDSTLSVLMAALVATMQRPVELARAGLAAGKRQRSWSATLALPPSSPPSSLLPSSLVLSFGPLQR